MAKLTVLLKGRELSRHDIENVTTRIGREHENEVVIDNPGVSRLHAAVIFEDPNFVLVDQGSANGIFVNGEQVSMHRLVEGDLLQVGKFEVRFSQVGGNRPTSLLEGELDVQRPKARNPHQTTAMSADDVHAQVAALVAKRAAEAAAAPPPEPEPSLALREARPTLREPPEPEFVSAPRSGEAIARSDEKGLRAVAFGLGTAVVLLAGMVIWLLVK
ncbi:MAG: putative component of type VI protein secretion system [Myxococcota bacterium]|jgi:predicted component of type VI protein secretion system